MKVCLLPSVPSLLLRCLPAPPHSISLRSGLRTPAFLACPVWVVHWQPRLVRGITLGVLLTMYLLPLLLLSQALNSEGPHSGDLRQAGWKPLSQPPDLEVLAPPHPHSHLHPHPSLCFQDSQTQRDSQTRHSCLRFCPSVLIGLQRTFLVSGFTGQAN